MVGKPPDGGLHGKQGLAPPVSEVSTKDVDLQSTSVGGQFEFKSTSLERSSGGRFPPILKVKIPAGARQNH